MGRFGHQSLSSCPLASHRVILDETNHYNENPAHWRTRRWFPRPDSNLHHGLTKCWSMAGNGALRNGWSDSVAPSFVRITALPFPLLFAYEGQASEGSARYLVVPRILG